MSIADTEHVRAAFHAIPQALANTAIDWRPERAQLQELTGGILNSNWLVSCDDKRYVMKVFGVGSENFVNRSLSHEAANQAYHLGLAPCPVYFNASTGFELTDFLSDYRACNNADFVHTDFLGAAIDLYRQFHHGAPLSQTKDVFSMTDEHLEQGEEIGALRPIDFAWLIYQYQRAKQAFMASGLDLVPCHNDPMPGNFMVQLSENGDILDMKLIDFEFASNNERAYEIGVFLGEVFADEDDTLAMIERYYGHTRPDVVARVWAARAVADMKWGSWAVQQRQLSDWDFDYQKYGIWKYARARLLFNDPRWNDWLRLL